MSNKLQQIVDTETDLFLEGAILESPRRDPKSDDGFWQMEKAIRPVPTEQLLRDPDVVRELKQRAPEQYDDAVDEITEQVALEFRRAVPAYKATNANYSKIVQGMAARILRDDRLDDYDAVRDLFESGKWTVRDITEEYKRQIAAGNLDLPDGSYKKLTDKEKLDVIAMIREGDTQTAVVQYVMYALSGQPQPAWQTPRQFLTAHPKLASEAASFVWSHLHAGDVNEDERREFLKSMQRHPILTITLMEQAFANWNLRREFSPVESQKHEPKIARVDLESLSDTEIADLYEASRRAYFE